MPSRVRAEEVRAGAATAARGSYYQQVEASRGTFGVFIESTGEKNPYRVHFQSPCFNLVGVMNLTCTGYMIADLITIGAALDFVIPDIDR